MASEWEADKKRILHALGGSGSFGDQSDMSWSLIRPESSRLHESTLAVRSSLDHMESIYANAITTYNATVTSGGPKPVLTESLSRLFSEDRDQEAAAMWEMVRSMDSLSPPAGTGQVSKWRQDGGVRSSIVKAAKKYLETAFKKFIQGTVFNNLQQAKLGGVPGTFHLVRSFLNVKIPPNTPGLFVDVVPLSS